MEVEEYLHSSFRPDCDFIEGDILERNVGLKRHSWALGHIGIWFGHRAGLCSLISMRLRVAPGRIRVADVVVVELPLPEEEVFTSPPWLCVEIMSPDDTMSSMQDRLDDYLRFGVPNIWVVDPWKLNIHPSFFSSLRTSRTFMNALLLQGEIIQAATSTSSACCEGSGTGSPCLSEATDVEFDGFGRHLPSFVHVWSDRKAAREVGYIAPTLVGPCSNRTAYFIPGYLPVSW